MPRVVNPRSRTPLLAAALLGASAALSLAPFALGGADEITVYAATSLRDVLQEMAPAWEKAIGARIAFNFGASNDLARQIEAGRKADVFISADEAWMDHVATAGAVDVASRRSILGNRLVVVGRAGSAPKIASAADLASPAVHRLALADPGAVPAGRYAKAWLERAGVWNSVADRVIPAIDVRAALAAIVAGGAEAGIVYRTDAAISKEIVVLFEVGGADAPAISYAAAAMAGRPEIALSRRAVEWLAGDAAAGVFTRYGFVVPARRASSSAPAATDAEEFAAKLRPILDAKCQPCHFEGGKVYDRLPFDRPETMRELGTKLFTRITDPGEMAIFQAFLDRPAPK